MRPELLNPIFAEVTALKGIGPQLARPLERLGLEKLVDELARFLQRIDFVQVDATGEAGWPELAKALPDAERVHRGSKLAGRAAV